MLKIQTPRDKSKILKQIEALKWEINHDVNIKDKEIHRQALRKLQEALEN